MDLPSSVKKLIEVLNLKRLLITRLQYIKKGLFSNLNPKTILMALQKVVNPKFDNPIWGIPANVIQYLFGYVNILIGAVGTILLQSSSIFTSTLTPMVGVGLVEVETVYPLFLGKTFKNITRSYCIQLIFEVVKLISSWSHFTGLGLAKYLPSLQTQVVEHEAKIPIGIVIHSFMRTSTKTNKHTVTLDLITI